LIIFTLQKFVLLEWNAHFPGSQQTRANPSGRRIRRIASEAAKQASLAL
jgi:hypothetical protein